MIDYDPHESAKYRLFTPADIASEGSDSAAGGSLADGIPLRRVAQVGGKLEMVYDGDDPVLARVRGIPGAVASGGGIRGKIIRFSPEAQKRLHLLCIRFLAGIAKTNGATHVTLTFGRDGGFDCSASKRALKIFRQRFERAHPATPYIWVVELQRRGAVHFHLLIAEVFTSEEVDHLSAAWVDVAGLSGSAPEDRLDFGLNAQEVDTSAVPVRLAAYLGKGMSKLTGKERAPHWKGHWYGKSNIKSDHLAPVVSIKEDPDVILERAIEVDQILRPNPRTTTVKNSFGAIERITSIPTQRLGSAAEFIAMGSPEALNRLRQEAAEAGIA